VTGWIVTIALRAASALRSFLMTVLPLRLRAVKAVVRSPEGRVLVVRHPYGSGRWMFPGGLARRRESFEVAVGREAGEELGLHGRTWKSLAVYVQRIGLTRQRVCLLTTMADESDLTLNREIEAVRFVQLDQLPDDVSPATARRLDELASGGLSGGDW